MQGYYKNPERPALSRLLGAATGDLGFVTQRDIYSYRTAQV